MGTCRYCHADNDPVNKSDANGHIFHIPGGAFVGALVETAMQAAEVASGARRDCDGAAIAGAAARGAAEAAIGRPGFGAVSNAVERGGKIAKALDAAAAGAKGAMKERAAPNPYGQHGKQDHKDKVKELQERAEREARPGESVVVGRKVEGYEGVNRRPDVQIRDVDGKTRKVFEAERQPTLQRNTEREAEYDRRGIANETHGVGEGAGRAKSGRTDRSNSKSGADSD